MLRCLVASISLCLALGCGGAVTSSSSFSLDAVPPRPSTTSGGSVSVSVAPTFAKGFTGTLALSVSGLPAGAGATFTPATLVAGARATLMLEAGSAAPGTYALLVVAQSGAERSESPLSWTIDSDAGTHGHDAGTDGGHDAGTDAGTDGGLDAGTDGGHDAGTDGGLDAGVDAGPDAGTDGGLDAGTDAGTGDHTAPTAAITSPLAGATVSGTASVAATAADAVGVVRVEFFADGARFATATATPYGAAWDTAALANGAHALQAKAYDAAGNVGASAVVNVTVANAVSDHTAPTAAISSPASNATLSGTASITANASDDVGVVKVEFRVDGALIATATTSPWSASWVTTGAANGSHSLTAKAFDAAGNSGTSAAVTVNVNNATPDTTAPTASLTAPAAGATLSGSTTITAAAADNVAVTKVEVWLDGALLASDPSAPYAAAWDTTAAANGAHTLVAKAYDAAGNVGTSAAVSVTVSNAAAASIKTVFVILMENHNWSSIKGSASAPYINNTLLPAGAHAEKYFNPPGLHPSEPNYLWLEAGTNFGVLNDSSPATNHQSTKAHLVTQLQAAGIAWKSYQEGITGTACPLATSGLYAPKHNPMVFFDDVTDTNTSSSANCIAHVRPYSELAGNLTANTVPRYVFITPDLCNDMHNSSGCATTDSVKNGDNWLSVEVPKILASQAYKSGGALFITWDESEGGDFPIGLIALSANAKKNYSNTIAYSHSSLLRTVQTIFAVSPLLGDAANATDLRDLFSSFP